VTKYDIDILLMIVEKGGLPIDAQRCKTIWEIERRMVEIRVETMIGEHKNRPAVDVAREMIREML